MEKRKGLYIGFVLTAGMMWGFTGVFVRCLIRWGFSSMQVVVCRAAATTALLGMYFLMADRSWFRVRLKDVGLFLLMGFCSVAVFNGCYFQAILRLGSMSVASVLLYTSPVFVAVLAALVFHERITGLKWLAVAANFVGCVCVSAVSADSIRFSVSGILMGITAGLAYALYSIFGRIALSRGYHPLTIVFYMWLFGLVCCLPLGQAGSLLKRMGQSPWEIGVCLLFGLISAAVPYALYTKGLQHVSTSTAGVLSSTEPCMASLLGVCVFGEPLTGTLCIGLLGVMGSVILMNYTDRDAAGKCLVSEKTGESDMILDDWMEAAGEQGLNIYDFAFLGPGGSQYRRLQPANACNNSYSVAKAFTVTAIGLLWDQGLLQVEDLVYELLKEAFPAECDPRWRKVTVEQLMTHRAGFGRGFLDIDVEKVTDYPSRDFLRIVLSEPLPYEPGSHEQYTDAAFYLLSRIVTYVTGEKLDDFLRPVLMGTMEFQEMAWSRCPYGYPMGATGLYINTRDMAKLGWVYANGGWYQGKQVVSKEWVELVLERGYEFRPVGEQGMYGKGGMFGQMLCFSVTRGEAYAWHGYESKKDVGILLKEK